MRTLLHFLGSALLLTGFFACETKVPDRILSEALMEDVLYDYHLACAMASQAKDSVSFREKQYVEAVFRKYKITAADFDSSLVWYTRHTSRLFNIYKEVNQRYADIVVSVGGNAEKPRFTVSASGDTSNIWSGDTDYLLRTTPGYNRMSFAYTPDSTFMPGDRYLFHIQTSFKNQELRKEAVVALMARYANDSISSRSMMFYGNGHSTVTLATDEKLPLKELIGFVYTNAFPDTKEQLLELSDMTLLHIRKKSREIIRKDTALIAKDTLVVDSVHTGKEQRLYRPAPKRKVRGK